MSLYDALPHIAIKGYLRAELFATILTISLTFLSCLIPKDSKSASCRQSAKIPRLLSCTMVAIKPQVPHISLPTGREFGAARALLLDRCQSHGTNHLFPLIRYRVRVNCRRYTGISPLPLAAHFPSETRLPVIGSPLLGTFYHDTHCANHNDEARI